MRPPTDRYTDLVAGAALGRQRIAAQQNVLRTLLTRQTKQPLLNCKI